MLANLANRRMIRAFQYRNGTYSEVRALYYELQHHRRWYIRAHP